MLAVTWMMVMMAVAVGMLNLKGKFFSFLFFLMNQKLCSNSLRTVQSFLLRM